MTRPSHLDNGSLLFPPFTLRMRERMSANLSFVD
jgi:hypothetical protein